ncbi:hypothetical protein BB559_000803 [Furculomyces boomerangus]|uniref:Bromodomain associated domain-containing protein n=2 Tax=Harpellales TaxID=61421 RepID=A0A2T9Z460_9FUNG|nr:hypothetical protein BB559_000803 [Furculomyces boomerangus]PVZ98676.1 hypothetical protein BB558_005317 [Smittium angustum]
MLDDNEFNKNHNNLSHNSKVEWNLSLMKKVVATTIVSSTNFDRAQDSSILVLSEIASQYTKLICKLSKLHAEQAGRTELSLSDLTVLSDLGLLNLDSLNLFLKDIKRNTRNRPTQKSKITNSENFNLPYEFQYSQDEPSQLDGIVPFANSMYEFQHQFSEPEFLQDENQYPEQSWFDTLKDTLNKKTTTETVHEALFENMKISEIESDIEMSTLIKKTAENTRLLSTQEIHSKNKLEQSLIDTSINEDDDLSIDKNEYQKESPLDMFTTPRSSFNEMGISIDDLDFKRISEESKIESYGIPIIKHIEVVIQKPDRPELPIENSTKINNGLPTMSPTVERKKKYFENFSFFGQIDNMGIEIGKPNPIKSSKLIESKNDFILNLANINNTNQSSTPNNMTNTPIMLDSQVERGLVEVELDDLLLPEPTLFLNKSHMSNQNYLGKISRLWIDSTYNKSNLMSLMANCEVSNDIGQGQSTGAAAKDNESNLEPTISISELSNYLKRSPYAGGLAQNGVQQTYDRINAIVSNVFNNEN